ncbi:MAG: leukotoxin LktA family filamentous adhesin [Rhodobacteraceae bacterium]|nr:leukotoxin LktA family filamentous adhesin [Paracoccaceae bacterium]
MGKHSSLLHIEHSRQQRARQRRALFNQFVLGASPLVLGALMGTGIAERAAAQAVNLDIISNNIIADGRTRTTVTTTDTHTRITTDTVSGNVGFNTFSDFQQAAGTRVDLFVPDAAGSLVNIVSNGAVVINGELNSYMDGSIGGNVFFASSNGFIVGQNGRINVGSLTVNTPTQEFLDRVVRADGTVNDAVASQLMRGEIPMSADGHIAIMGQVNAQGAITLQGQTISINGNTGPLTGADLGQRTKFEATVNAGGMLEGAALVAHGGRISIIAAGGSRVGGRLDVSTADAGRGGEISVTGGDITVEAGAALAADGASGGDIVVFADGTLVVQDTATFSAAGLGLGDGGFIELSGRDAHIGSVNLDLSSRAGRAGTLLIDPWNLYIGGVPTSSGGVDDASVATSIFSNGASILLQADNSITVTTGGVLDSRMLTAGVTSGNSGNITLEAPMITLEDGAKVLAGVTTGSTFTGGDVTLTAARTNGGTAHIVIGQGGASGPEITGRDITLNASSTVNQASLLLALPTANALITANSGTITASRLFKATASAVGAGGVSLLPLGIVVTNVQAKIDIGGTTEVTAALVELDASSQVQSSIVTQSLAPVNSSADGAVAVSTINSTAIARIGGSAKLDVTGDTSLTVHNIVTSESDATPQAAAFGASVGVSVVNAITTAEIVDAAEVSAGALALLANTSTDISVNATAGAGGATTPSPGSMATTYLTDPSYGGQAQTSGGGVSVAGALAISDLTSTTNARINSTATTTVTGALSVNTGSENAVTLTADGSTVDSATGVGVAIGINIAKVVNDAVIASAVNTGSAHVAALAMGNGNTFATSATSGAGASNVGIAGSFALNLLDTQAVARVSGAAVLTVSGGGAVALSTDNRTESTAEALPVGGGATGETVGVGASVALNILANRSVAEVANGGVVTGAGNLTLGATATHVAATKAEAGSSGGVSITPALALSLINNTTTARLGSGGAQSASGAVSISAAQHSTITTEASGKAAGSTAAIGAALALALVDDRTTATTARNISAGGAVSFSASGVSDSTLTATASAAGAKDAEDEDAAPDSTGESVDKSATREFTAGSGKQQASGVGSADQQSSTSTAAADEDGRSAKSSEGKVAVAAAVAINVQTSQVQALVPDGVSITAGGAITVASGATTSGSATSDGQAVKGEDGGTSQVGIGVAVSVNVVKETNTAYLGAAIHSGAGVNVRALQAVGAPTDTFLTSATSGAGGSKVGIAGSVALNILTLDTTARIAGGASVAAGAGASSITAKNAVSSTAKAQPSDAGVTGGEVGVGASFAMNLVTATTTAELQNGATLTGGAGLAVAATSNLTTLTEASAGAAGGIAVDASVALALLNQTTIARIGTGNALAMGAGAVSVIATNTGSNTATSTGENKSDKVGVGASAAVILGNGASGGALKNTSITTATLARSITAGSLTITASANRTYDANATATAGGGDFSESDEKKNEKTGGTSTTADSLDKTKDSQRDQDGKSDGAKVTIAAAAGIAAAQDVVSARLEGVTVNVAGAIAIGATNTVGMTASGIGAATNPNSKVGIGVGVGLAILNNTTSATIADNAQIVHASGISIAATSRENADGPYRSKLTALGIAGASGKNVAVAGSIAVAISTGSTEAKIGSNVTVTNGGAMSLAVDNESHLSAKALAGSVSTSGVAVGGSIAVVVADTEYEASVGADSTLTGSALSITAINRKIDAAPDFNFGSLDDLDAFADSLADLATGKLLGNSNYYVEAIGGAGGSGVAVQGSFGVMVFSDSLTAAVGSNATVNVGSGAVTLSTDADFVAKALSGALSASTSSAAVGVSATVIVSEGETVSRLGQNANITSAGSFSNTASATQDIRSYAASASAASSTGVSGVAGVITSQNRVEALMARGARVTISGAGAVSLGATNDFDVFALAAGVGVGGTAGIGAAATVVVVNNTTRAALADGTSAADRAEINASGPISITATATEDGDLFSVAGAAGGTAGVGAGAGIYVFGTTTEALIGDYAKVGTAFNAGSLTVQATDTSRLFSVAGAAGAGGTAGAGAGVAVGVISKATSAEIGANALVDSANVAVKATSAEDILAITAGVGVGGSAGLAGAVTVLSVSPTTTARIGANARVHANGNVAVTADGKTEIDMVDGAFAAGAAGIGASVGVTVINATTLATVDAAAKVTALGNGAAQSYVTGYAAGFSAYGSDNGFAPADFNANATDELTDANAASARTAGLNMLGQRRDSSQTTATARGVIVNATDKASVRALSVGGAAGSVGIAVSAGVPVITTDTRAQIAAGAQINRIAGSAASTQNVTVAAASDIYTMGFSGAVAGGAVAGGAGVSVMVIDTTTQATIGAGEVTAEGDVAVTARATQDIVGIGAAGAAAGSVALAGGISVIDVTTATKAEIAGTVTAQGNVDVIADDKTRTAVVAGALAVGYVGVGAAVSVVNLNKEITASIASGATVSALGLRGNHTIYTGNAFGDTRSASRGVNVQANSGQSGFTLGVAGSAGGVGVAGVVTLYLMDVATTASIGTNAAINTAGGNATGNGAQDVVVSARDETITSVAAGGIAVGLFGGLAGVVDVGVFKNTTAAFIGDNVTLNAKRDVLVSGLASKAGEAYVMGAGGGIVGLAAGIAVYNYGDGVAPGGEADKNIGEASDDGSLSFASITSGAQSQANNGEVNDMLAQSDDARVRDVSQSAQNRRNQIDVASAASALTIPAGTSASIGSGTINAGGTVGVKSSDALNVNIVTGAVAVGALGGGAGIGVLTVDTGSTAQIDGTGTLTAGAVTVNASTNHTFSGLHFAGSGGLLAAISADVGIHTDTSRTTATIKRKAVSTTGAVAVNASSTRNITVDAIGVSVAGTLAVGASVGEATVGGAVNASVSNGATIGSLGSRAASVSVTSSANSTADTEAYAVGGGIGAALQGAGSLATVTPVVTASVDSAQIYTSGLTNVQASANGSSDTLATGIAVAGGLAAGASTAISEVSSTVSTTVANGTVIDAGSIAIGTNAVASLVKSRAIGAAGALVGLNATVTKSQNFTNANTAVTGSALVSSGAATVSAANTTNQLADGTGLAAGFIAAGFNISEAKSATTTTATLTNLTMLSAGALNLTAVGTDTNNAVTVAGSGGLVAGSAATSKTSTVSTTRAAADTTGAAAYGMNVAGAATISALHTSNFAGSVDSTQASLVGASGASLAHTVSSTVDARIGDRVQLTAQNLTLSARNITLNPFLAGGANNVRSISGGLANVPAGGATVAITHTTTAAVGALAAVRLTQPTVGPSLFKQEAYNNIVSKQKVNLDSGGAIALANAEIDAVITANATASVGGTGKVEVDYGDIQIAAWGEGDLDMRATATTYGLAGAPSGDANITYTGANTVSIGNDALVQATDGDNPTNGDMPRYATVTIGAGTGPLGQVANLVFNATVDIFNKTAIPIPTAPNPTVIVANSGLVTVGTTSSTNMNLDPQGVRAAGDIRISVNRGNISATAVGTGKDIYREALAAAASAVSNAFGGGDVTFDYHGGSTSTGGGISRVDINGRVETGIQRYKTLTIDETCEPTALACIANNASGNIEFDVSGPNPVGTDILARVAELKQLILDYATDPIAKAAYQNEINFLHNKLVGLGLGSFDAGGNFVPGTYAGPSPKAALEAAAAADAASISTVKVQLNVVAPTNIVAGLTELTDGVKGLYEDGTYGLIVSVNNTIAVIQTMSTYVAGTHGPTVTSLQTLRNQGLAAAAAAKTAEADTITRRNTNIAKAAEIATAQAALADALVASNAGAAATQQGIIAAAQTVIAGNLTLIASNTATIADQSAIARDRAASLASELNALLNSLPANATAGLEGDALTTANNANAADAAKKAALTAAATTSTNASGETTTTIPVGAYLTSVGLNASAVTTTVSDLGAVLTSINSAVATLNANTGATPGTVDGTKSLTQFVGILGTLTTSFATTTQAAAAASSSSGTPLAYTIEVADTAARLGNIFITGDQLRTTSSGKLLAPGDAKIQITNNTHHTLKLGNLIVPEYDAGNLRFNGVLVYGPADITSLNAGGMASGFANLDVVTSRTSSRGLIEIISTYTPEAFPLAQRKIAPDIILKRGSVIENTTGAVRIISEAGNIYIQGTINAGSVEILAKDGDFVASYVNGFNHIGGDPASFTVHTSTSEQGPGITANGAISISARYLNINSTIQSGIAEWNLSLGAAPTLTASAAAIGVSQAALDAANLVSSPTVLNSAGQAIVINRTPMGIDATELETVVNQYKDEVLVNPNADPVRTIAIFGVATQVNIKDYLSSQITFSLQFTKAQAEAYVAANPGSDGVFSVVRASVADNIGASYDAKNQQYVVNGASVKGGYIQLFGQIMNTASSTAVGKLNVLDGFGTINITNTSNIPVVLRNLSTGEDPTGTLRGIEGRIEITDVTGLVTTGAYSPSNPLITVRKTVYTRDYVPGDANGVVRVATQTGTIDNATGNLILGGVVSSNGADRGTTYAPVANQRYVWTTGEEYKRTSNYSQVSTQLFGSESLTISSITSLTLSGTPLLLNTYRLADGTYVTTQSTITGGGLTVVNGAAFQNPNATVSTNVSLSGTQLSTANQSTFTKNDFVKTGESSRRCNWWTLCIASEKTYYYELRQEYTTIITESLKADYPIGVNFIGSNTGAINVTSTGGDVVLTSNIKAVAGTVTINAGTTPGSGASIIQGDLAGEIRAKTISLTADAFVGGITNPHAVAAPIAAALAVNLTGTPGAGYGALSANAKNGNVEIISRGNLVVDQVTAAGSVTAGRGTINLFSFGSIDGKDQTARIQAPRVTLAALSGSVGSTANGAMLRVNTGYTIDPAQRVFGDPELDPLLQTNPLFGLSVTAAGNIGIRSDGWAGNTDGTMLVHKVLTTGGDVRLSSTGQILDNNPVQSIDQRTYDQLLGFWESLGLLANDPSRGVNGSANEDKQENAVKAFEASTTQTYNQYWRVRGDAAYDPAATVEVAPGSAQYRALDAQFRADAIAAGEADPDAYVATKIADVGVQQTAEYHRLHGVVGGLTTEFVDGYSYVASDDQKAELTRGSVWTERELAFSIAPGALKTVTATNPVLKDPNVSGRTVTIEAGLGIGETIGAGTTGPLGVSIRSSLDPRDLTLDQKVALASAERDDLQLTLGPVNLPAGASADQIAAYNAAVALGLGTPGVLTTLMLGAEFDTLSAVQQAALNAAALGLVAPEHTLLTVLSKRPLNFNAVTALNVSVPNVSSGTNADIGGAFLASRGGATLGTISTYGDTRIKVFGDIINAPASSVQTGNLILEAAQGGVGTVATPLTLSPRTGATTTARAQNGVNIAFTGSGLIDTVYSQQDVKLTAQNSLLNAYDDELISVLGAKVTLRAVTGSIGTVTRSLNVGVSVGGQILATAANEINLFGPSNSLFIIGSALAGGTIRLAAAGQSVIDGLVETAGTINLAAGGRQLFTALADVHSVAGLVDINSASLKMLNGATLRADAGRVQIATDGNALVTGITSGSGDADAVKVTAGGRIFAGTLDPRTDITAMAAGAGVVLSAGLGIGDKTQANMTALDNAVTDTANPLRIRTNTLAATATDGGINLAALTDMVLSNLQSPNGPITVVGDGTLDITLAQSGGSQHFTADGDLTFVNLQTTGIPAVPGPEDAGDITLTSVNGDVLGGSLNAAGSAWLSGDNVTFDTATTGLDATMTSGPGAVNILTSLNAGRDSYITGNGVFFDTIIAGRDSTIYSTGDIIGELEQAGETLINIAGFGPGNSGILDVKVMRAKNIELQATGTLDVGVIEVGENLTLRADIIRALDVTQVPSGPDPLNVTLSGPDGTAATFAQVNIDAPAGIVMPLLHVSETLFTTTAGFVNILNGIVPIQGNSPMAGTLLLTTPLQTVFVDDRSQTPKANPPSNVQMFLNGAPFTLRLDGTATATNSFVVVYDATVQVTDLLGLPFPGISLVRDTVRNMREAGDPILLPGAFGSTPLEEDEDDLELADLNGTVVEIDGVAYNIFVRGNGPAVLLRQ